MSPRTLRARPQRGRSLPTPLHLATCRNLPDDDCPHAGTGERVSVGAPTGGPCDQASPPLAVTARERSKPPPATANTAQLARPQAPAVAEPYRARYILSAPYMPAESLRLGAFRSTEI